MKILLKNGFVVNVFTEEILRVDVLIEDDKIIGVDNYSDNDADIVKDITGKYVCPGFIDSHIHIESTMLCPYEFARVSVPHGTSAIIADPHEIANVCGKDGIRYMLETSQGLPLTVYVVLPSCVPATSYDEAGAVLKADDLEEFYSHPRVIGLGEVMDYPGVICRNEEVYRKIDAAKKHGVVINGHAPLLTGKDLDKYISSSIRDDHECTSDEEAKERIRKGQKVMVRQGSAAKNLQDLISMFDKPWSERCLLVSDDKHPADLLNNGHIDDSIRVAVSLGKSAITAIKMATLNAAMHYGLSEVGAVAPGYIADILVLDDLDTVKVCDVYKNGKPVVVGGSLVEFPRKTADPALEKKVKSSFNISKLSDKDFYIDCSVVKKCNVIKLSKSTILTEKGVLNIDFSKNNGIDVDKDILKIAVIERHKHTGHIGLGFISGLGLKYGAIASSVAHDSHNIIIIGSNESDMATAANRIREIGGGIIAVRDGCVLSEMPLPIAGLMSETDAYTCAEQNEKIRKTAHSLGCYDEIEPFMLMSFVSLAVIPHIKITTLGLFDVDSFELMPLFVV